MASDRELDAFASWLTERGLARENRVRFLVGWVNRFQRLRVARSGETWKESLKVFLQDLTAGGTKYWQVRQAGEAITLYCGQFCVPEDTQVCAKTHTDSVPDDALSEMQSLLRLRHYSPRTEGSYLGWARRFLARTPRAGNSQPTATDVRNFISHLATERKVPAATQNQAFNALFFLFRNVFHVELGDMHAVVRARRGRKLPVVLSTAETKAVLDAAEGTGQLML